MDASVWRGSSAGHGGLCALADAVALALRTRGTLTTQRAQAVFAGGIHDSIRGQACSNACHPAQLTFWLQVLVSDFCDSVEEVHFLEGVATMGICACSRQHRLCVTIRTCDSRCIGSSACAAPRRLHYCSEGQRRTAQAQCS